ncbi:WXG100 family type VII secretion target [Cellulomonas hominis]
MTYQDLDAVAGQLEVGRGDLEAELLRLKGLVDDLIGAGFATDKASGAFASAYEEYDSGTKAAVAGLEGMYMFLKKAAEAYEATDAQLSAAIAG